MTYISAPKAAVGTGGSAWTMIDRSTGFPNEIRRSLTILPSKNQENDVPGSSEPSAQSQ